MNIAKDPIINAIYNEIKRGIQITLDNKCLGSALILICSGVDIMANLSRPVGAREARDSDFVRWAEKYMKVVKEGGITGEELYSARCAIIHTYGVESRRTRKGTARKIAFIHKGYCPVHQAYKQSE